MKHEQIDALPIAAGSSEDVARPPIADEVLGRPPLRPSPSAGSLKAIVRWLDIHGRARLRRRRVGRRRQRKTGAGRRAGGRRA